MTLLYNDPKDTKQQFPTPYLVLSSEDSESQKILSNWFSFVDTLEPEFSKLTFFPENILPYDKADYLKVFTKEFKTHKKLGTLTPEILNSIAINVCNLYRFSKLVDKGIHKIYFQNVLDHPEQIAMFDKKSLLDTYLQQGLTENIFAFCESEGFPKNVMYHSNSLYLLTTNQEYNDLCKSKFLNKEPNFKKIPAQHSYKDDDSNGPDGTLNTFFEKNKLAWVVVVIVFSTAWVALMLFIAK